MREVMACSLMLVWLQYSFQNNFWSDCAHSWGDKDKKSSLKQIISQSFTRVVPLGGQESFTAVQEYPSGQEKSLPVNRESTYLYTDNVFFSVLLSEVCLSVWLSLCKFVEITEMK